MDGQDRAAEERHRRGRFIRLLATSLLLTSGATAPPAMAIEYGDFIVRERRLVFEDVESAGGQLGAPALTAEGLVFGPSTLESTCSRCPGGYASSSETVSLEIATYHGFRPWWIGLELEAFGDLSTGNGEGTLSGGPFALVHPVASLEVQILETTFREDDVSDAQAFYEVFFADVSGGNPSLSFVYVPNASHSVAWNGELEVDLGEVAWRAGLRGKATRVSLSLTVTLHTYHDGFGGEASLSAGGLTLFTPWTSNGCLSVCDPDPPIPPGPPLPEPGTGILVMGGLAGLASRGRAKRPSRREPRRHPE